MEDFKEGVVSATEEELGKRRGKRKERWIQERTWKLVDERNSINGELHQVYTDEKKKEISDRYRDADKAVKRSCRKDKKDWFEHKGNGSSGICNDERHKIFIQNRQGIEGE